MGFEHTLLVELPALTSGRICQPGRDLLSGLMLSKHNCYKLQLKPVTSSVSNDLQHETSFTFHSSVGKQRERCSGHRDHSRGGFVDGVGHVKVLQWMCCFPLNIHQPGWVGGEFLFLMSRDYNPTYCGVQFLSTAWWFRATPTVSSLLPSVICSGLPLNLTHFYAVKSYRMNNTKLFHRKSFDTIMNGLLQWGKAYCRLLYTLCTLIIHEYVVNLLFNSPKLNGRARQSWITRHLIPH